MGQEYDDGYETGYKAAREEYDPSFVDDEDEDYEDEDNHDFYADTFDDEDEEDNGIPY